MVPVLSMDVTVSLPWGWRRAGTGGRGGYHSGLVRVSTANNERVRPGQVTDKIRARLQWGPGNFYYG